jgi:putative OPT family oligopeptide transporter
MSARHIVELTAGALGLGIVLSLLMCAANTYLGLYAGMTVSASIPAAVISMGILRGVFRRGTIHENNIVQTVASAGESLAAGIIFTVPALLISGVWFRFEYIPTTLVALLGGLLGVLFMIPLRRALIVEGGDLVYPEGVACAEVLRVGQQRGFGIVCVFMGLAAGVVFKFFVSVLSVIKTSVFAALRFGKTGVYFGSEMSVALIGVGYVVGANIALLVFLGGAIGWLVGIPVYGLLHGLPLPDVAEAFNMVWSTEIRYLGVGAMIVGGLWSIYKVRGNITSGMREALHGYRTDPGNTIAREQQDMPSRTIFIIVCFVAAAIFILYGCVTRSSVTGIVAGMTMLVTAFFFVAVSSYIVGLVGSSNNPVSGMVIVTVIVSSIILLVAGMIGTAGIIAALLVAGVVCCAACTAGDVSQDLKTGHLIGATPRNQQIAQIVGVGVAAFMIAPILSILHRAYGIGTGEPGALSAPQASLFASIVSAMFTDRSLPWTMVGIGACLGVLLIVIDELLKARGSRFRTHVMPVAVGIYLPLVLSVPIAIGGLVRMAVVYVRQHRRNSDVQYADQTSPRGVLFSSGLIAGEAITGIVVALIIVTGVSLPIPVLDSSIVSLLLFAAAVGMLVYFGLSCSRNDTGQ